MSLTHPAQTGYNWSIHGSFDLHVYQLFLLRAPHEPLRQRSGCVRVDDHTVI